MKKAQQQAQSPLLVVGKEIMRQLLSKKNSIHLNNNQGFTLIEILVALVLIALILAVSISNPLSSRDDLEKDVNGIERALRFMSDEAALKNAVIRLHFILEGDPQQYAVEYGPSDSFILPPKAEMETKTETKEELGEVSVEDTVNKMMESLELENINDILDIAEEYARSFTWKKISNQLEEIINCD